MATSSFVQSVNLNLVKKGRKYWTCIQRWEGHGEKRDYEVKMLIDDSNKTLKPGTELSDYPIIHVVSYRLYGLRRYKTKIEKDPDLPKVKKKRGDN